MKNRILCFTLYNSLNYGAFLQAFSIKEVLEKKYNKKVYFYRMPIKINFKGKSLKNKIFKISLILKNYKNIKKLKVINTKDGFDIAIVGSDEIWNVNNPTFYHMNEFFGIGLNSEKVVSLAASSNNSTHEDIIKKYDSNVFDNFDYISVRDTKTKNLFLKNNRYNDVYEILDPTFLIDWDNYYKDRRKKERYILLYGYHFSKKEIELIKKFANNKKMKVYSIGIYQNDYKNICCSPFEFINYVKHCDYMITKSFHGTIFSIIMKKNFVVFMEKNNIKIADLLKKMHLEDRLIENDINKLDCNINYNGIDMIIQKEREKSYEFINKWV